MREKNGEIVYVFEIFAVCITLCTVIFLLCLWFYSIPFQTNIATVGDRENICIIIDAGHGGRDGGASSESGILEKDLNLFMAHGVKDILLLCNCEIIMTRDTDTLACDENDPKLKGKIKMTDLNNRLKVSRENPNSIFVSIHMNKFPIEKYKGLQVYYSPHNENSFELAKSIQSKTVEVLQPNNTREVKKAGSNIFLLDRITTPAVLIECGFLSNREDAENLSSNEYRTKLALIFAECILANSNNLGIIHPNA